MYLLCIFEILYSSIPLSLHNMIFAVSLATCFQGNLKPDCLALLATTFSLKDAFGKMSPVTYTDLAITSKNVQVSLISWCTNCELAKNRQISFLKKINFTLNRKLTSAHQVLPSHIINDTRNTSEVLKILSNCTRKTVHF